MGRCSQPHILALREKGEGGEASEHPEQKVGHILDISCKKTKLVICSAFWLNEMVDVLYARFDKPSQPISSPALFSLAKSASGNRRISHHDNYEKIKRKG